jgi:hypothetical protein
MSAFVFRVVDSTNSAISSSVPHLSSFVFTTSTVLQHYLGETLRHHHSLDFMRILCSVPRNKFAFLSHSGFQVAKSFKKNIYPCWRNILGPSPKERYLAIYSFLIKLTFYHTLNSFAFSVLSSVYHLSTPSPTSLLTMGTMCAAMISERSHKP